MNATERNNQTNELPDDLNPEMIFNGTADALLVMAVNGEIDLADLAKAALANRGLDKSGTWVGFQKAREALGLSKPIRL